MGTTEGPVTGQVPEQPAGIPRHGVVRNSAYGFAFQLLGAVLAAITTIFLARALGPDHYGTYALAMSVGALFALPADFGISPSAHRFVAEHVNDRRAVAAVLGDAFRLKLLIAGPASIALALAAGPIADAYDSPGLVWPLRAAALALFCESFVMLSTGAFIALGRVTYNLKLLPLGLVALALTIALVLAGAGATGAVLARAVGLALVGGAGAWLLWRLVGRPTVRLRGGSGQGRRRIAGYAGPIVLVDSAFALFSQLDVLLIGALLGSAQAGLFQAPLRIVIFLHYVGYAIGSAVAPRLAHRDGEGASVRAFVGGLRVTILVQAGLAAVLVPWAQPISDLVLGPEYQESADVLRAFAPFVLLSGIAPVVGLGANYLGEARRRLPVTIAAVAVNLAVDLALLRELGIVAGVIGSTLAYLLYVPVHLRICRRRLGFPLRPLVLTLLRALVAAAALGCVLALFGTTELSAAEWVLGTAAGTAAYAAVLLGTGELTLDELRSTRARLVSLATGRDA